MKWSDLNIWENFKNFFESITKKNNYNLILFFTFLYTILIFTLYPFLTNNLKETLKKYLWILVYITAALMLLFLFFCSQLKGAIELNKGFYPALVSMETFIIIFIIIFIVYSNRSWFDGFIGPKQIVWNVVNITLVFVIIIIYMTRSITCYVSSVNNIKCNNGEMFDTWWITTTILSGLFILLSIYSSYSGLDGDILYKQGLFYLILIFFISRTKSFKLQKPHIKYLSSKLLDY